jgi:hypothetical protein
MTPVAGGVTDGKENRFVFRFGLCEGFIGPGMPVYRIVSMLDKIGAFFIYEVIGGHLLLLWHYHLIVIIPVGFFISPAEFLDELAGMLGGWKAWKLQVGDFTFMLSSLIACQLLALWVI